MKNKGFTLIELLVVISIISMLSTVVLSEVRKVQIDSRIRSAEGDLIQIRNAVQLYKTQYNGKYPNATSFDNLLLDLKNNGLYTKSKFDKDFQYRLVNGLQINPGGNIYDQYSCGGPDYANTYYLIYFFSWYIPLDSKSNMERLYWRGDLSNTVAYCVNI